MGRLIRAPLDLKNKDIAVFYSLPHLVLPIPAMALGPIALAMGMPFRATFAVGAGLTLCIALFVLPRLPNLRVRESNPKFRTPPGFAKGLMLMLPLFLAMQAQDAGLHATGNARIDALQETRAGEYYEIALPHAPSFADLHVVREERSPGIRGTTKQILVTAVLYGEIGGARVFLLEMPQAQLGNMFGQLDESDFAKSEQSMVGYTQVRFDARTALGSMVVKRLSISQFPQTGFRPSDILLQWNVETPEHNHATYMLMSAVFYVFPYCLLAALLPVLVLKEDPVAVARFSAERSVWRKLFMFRRATR